MYVSPDFPTKKALREALEVGKQVILFATGLGNPTTNGVEFIEGPHYPKPHTWYAKVKVVDGKIVAIDGKAIKVKQSTE